MTAIIVIGCILLLLFGICAIRATVFIDYKDEFSLAVSLLGIKIGILPKKEKKVNIKKYSAKHYRKLQRKRELDEEKKRQKKLIKAEKSKEKKLKKQQEAEKKKAKKKKSANGDETERKKKMLPLGDILTLVSDTLSILFARFCRHFRIKVARLNITVASEDAAKTAILYGVASQGVAYILEILDRTTNLDYQKDAEVNVLVDYLAEAPTVDISISFSLRVWHLFDMLLRAAFSAIKNLVKSK